MPTFSFTANSVLDLNDHIIKGHSVQRMTTVNRNDGVHLDARRIHRDTQKGNALLLSFLGRGPGEQKHPISMLSKAGPDFRPGHAVAVTVLGRLHFQ